MSDYILLSDPTPPHVHTHSFGHLCGRPSTEVAVLPRDAQVSVLGGNVAAITALPPVAYIPNPKEKSGTAGVALPDTSCPRETFFDCCKK